MSNGFDAYHKWLSIPPHDQPPNHYRLLGLGLFESDPDVVAAAADRQMAHVQTYKTGPNSELSQKLLNEISAAKLCLLRPHKKTAYDEQLRRQLATAAIGFGPLGTATVPPGMTPLPPTGVPAARITAVSPVGAGSAGVPHGSPYPAYPGASRTPPPPTLPPPVTATSQSLSGDSTRPLVGVTAILIASGIVAVLLVIGIVVVLTNRSAHSTGGYQATAGKATVDKRNAAIPIAGPEADSNGRSPGNAKGSTVPVPPVTVVNPAISKAHRPKSSVSTANASDPAKSPSPSAAAPIHAQPSPSEVATTITSGNLPPEKKATDKPNVEKPSPGKAPIKPVSNPPHDPSLAGKTAVPDGAAIAAAEQRLGNLSEIQPIDLLDQAHKATGATDIYVLLRRALDSAVKQGDAGTAISAADELARRFAVNSLQVRSQTLDDLPSHVSTLKSWDALANAAAALIDDATAAAQPDLVEHLAELSISSARKSGNVDTIRKITLRIIHLHSTPPPISASNSTF